jgi:hypothetical protein
MPGVSWKCTPGGLAVTVRVMAPNREVSAGRHPANPDTRAGSPEDLWGNPNPASTMSGGGVAFVKTTAEEIVAVRWAP